VKRLVRVGMACLFLLVAILPLSSQDQSLQWQALIRQANDLRRKGEYDHAVEIAQQALDLAEAYAGPYHPAAGVSLNFLALIYSAQGNYAQAEPLFERALAIRTKVLGEQHPKVAWNLECLSELYRNTGRIEDAQTLKRRAASIRALQQSNPVRE
jgi:tetratricopeptide (TPR) repeat protein